MGISIVRTLVPIVYALLIKLGLDRLGIKEEEIQNLAALLTVGLVYVALRLMEQLQPKLGWLLGYPVEPQYVPAGTLVVQGEVADSADLTDRDPGDGDLRPRGQ